MIRSPLNWTETAIESPPDGETVLCGRLNKYVNAPWDWSFWTVYHSNGRWGDCGKPDVWAHIPAPPTPMNAAHRKALKGHAKEQEYRRKRDALDKEYKG